MSLRTATSQSLDDPVQYVHRSRLRDPTAGNASHVDRFDLAPAVLLSFTSRTSGTSRERVLALTAAIWPNDHIDQPW
jgi:hypothetical protein